MSSESIQALAWTKLTALTWPIFIYIYVCMYICICVSSHLQCPMVADRYLYKELFTYINVQFNNRIITRPYSHRNVESYNHRSIEA